MTWQAGRGQSLIHSDKPTLIAFTVVVVLTAAVTARVITAARRGIAAPIEVSSAR